MNIKQAIDRADELSPNGFTQDQKIRWLSTLDNIIYEKIITTHEGAEDISFDGYDKDTPLDTELFVGEPYDEIYLYWLWWHYDYANKEYNGYNNNVSLYNAVYSDFAAWYNRTHRPLQTAKEVFF